MPDDVDKYLFDVEYQKKILKYLVQENKSEFVGYLSDALFDTYELKEIFRFISKWVDEYLNVPEFDTILHQCGGVFDRGDELPINKQKIMEAVKEITAITISIEDIRKVLTDFIKAQQMRHLLVDMSDDFQRGKYNLDEYGDRMAAIKNVDIFDKFGIRMSNFQLFEKPRVERIKTHLSKLNHWFKGGLERGELGFLLAQPYLGKSMFLLNNAVRGYKQNLNVFYYTFELSEYHAYLRCAEMLTSMTDDEILGIDDDKRADAKRQLFKKKLKHSTRYKGDIVIKEYPTGGATINDMVAHMRGVEALYKLKPDLVLVDYADLVKPSRWFDEDHERVANVVEGLRRIAQEHNCAVWTVSQIKQDEYDQELRLNSGSRSIRKVEVADVAIGMFRNLKKRDEMVITFLKFRRGISPKEKKFPVKLDQYGNMREITETTETKKKRDIIR